MRRQVAEESIQLNGRIRRSCVWDAFPCQRHLGLLQEISSSPNISTASSAESKTFAHFLCKLILSPLLGHLKMTR